MEADSDEPIEVSTYAHFNRTSSAPPSLRTGYLLLTSSIILLLVGSYATLFSAFIPASGWKLLSVLEEDNHYKYFMVLLVPTAAYVVIANWVGWQYYRNS